MKANIKKIVTNCVPHFLYEKRYGNKNVPKIIDTGLGEPEIYNKNGSLMRVFYLKDKTSAHFPYYSNTRYSQYIMWDRYNYSLPIHFYGSGDLNTIMGEPPKKFAWFNESESIVPAHYQKFYKAPEMAKEFDAVFTYSDKMLDLCDNAKFIPGCNVWYSSPAWGGSFDPLRYEKKNKNISMMCSGKTMCELHLFRNAIAEKYLHSNVVDVMGSYTGRYLEHKADSLDEYRYQIVIENDITKYYFTEKILDCFASMTVPIYLGATAIGDFFNMDGIITFDMKHPEEIDDILKNCNEKDYNERKEAILDNYNRVMEYVDMGDYIMEHYLELF